MCPPPLKQSYFNSFHHIVLNFGCIIYKSISPHRNTICFKVHDFVTSLMHLIGCIRHKCFSLHRNTFCFKRALYLSYAPRKTESYFNRFAQTVSLHRDYCNSVFCWSEFLVHYTQTHQRLFVSKCMNYFACSFAQRSCAVKAESYEHISAATERDMRAM